MESFENYIESIKAEIPGLANELGEFKEGASSEATSFINNSKEDLIRWTTALKKGGLTKNDFEWLVKSKKDLLKLNGLKAAGLAEIKAEKFINALIEIAIKKAILLVI